MTSAGSVGSGGTLRLFLALQLPLHVREALDRWGEAQLAGDRRIPRDNLHVTLAFLGARPVGDLPGILSELRETTAGAGPIALAPAGWRDSGRVGMLELRDENHHAAGLAEGLQRRLAELGVYRPERRCWLPHITMVRFRERSPRPRPSLPPVGTFVPSGAAAYISHLHPSGARYEVLESIPLAHGDVNPPPQASRRKRT